MSVSKGDVRVQMIGCVLLMKSLVLKVGEVGLRLSATRGIRGSTGSLNDRYRVPFGELRLDVEYRTGYDN